MVMQEDAIVDIPEHRVKFFGTTGKMLLPCPATLAAVIEKVPQDKLITTEALREALSRQFEVEATCPVTTRKSLMALAQEKAQKTAYWRVVNGNGGLIVSFPGGTAGHAALLKNAGFAVDNEGKTPKVQKPKEVLYRFA